MWSYVTVSALFEGKKRGKKVSGRKKGKKESRKEGKEEIGVRFVVFPIKRR